MTHFIQMAAGGDSKPNSPTRKLNELELERTDAYHNASRPYEVK
jgi:hypothetical protein